MTELPDDFTAQENVRKAIEKSNMPRRVAESTVDKITPAIAEHLAFARETDSIADGFGVSGPVGSGKTGVVAATLIERLRIAAQERRFSMEPASKSTGGYSFPESPLCWISWPDTVNELRVLSSREGGVDEAAKIVRRMSHAQWLVLDDLGAERIRGDYADDWATTQLDLVLDRRYVERMPTWYTTSLTMPEFVARYGRRMIERLCAQNPLIELPSTLESRRLG